MTTVRKILSEALGESVTESKCAICDMDPCDCDHNKDVKEHTDIARLRHLSGLRVDEGLGYGEQQLLNKLLQDIEISINRTEGLLKRYAQQVNKMSAHMGEEDQMHYVYGIQAMIDLVDGMQARVQKLG